MHKEGKKPCWSCITQVGFLFIQSLIVVLWLVLEQKAPTLRHGGLGLCVWCVSLLGVGIGGTSLLLLVMDR